MKGFVRKIGRPTKGGSLPVSQEQSSSRRITLRKVHETKQRDRDVAPSLNGKSNGAISRDNLPAFLRETIEKLVASESVESSDLANGARELSERLDRTTPPQSGFPRANPQWIFDGAELNGAELFHIPRWKRILDLTSIFLTLPIWLPLMILLMLWVKVSSPGPVFYRQERVGYRRDRFMLFKFRTMHVNAETRTHEEYFAHLMRADCPMKKLDAEGDSRLIKGGLFLRASGLDELPQIFNVLRGEMSLVGPRPCLPHEFQGYKVWQQRRVNTPPGLTGYWQVNGKNKTTFSEMIAMDLFYASNMSLWLDLAIMLKTIPALIGQMLESRRTSRPALRTQVIGQPYAVAESLNGSVRRI
jgi:lipopolysaccharide/colanic/teichoic acid biosynthesis glycosyltransferase